MNERIILNVMSFLFISYLPFVISFSLYSDIHVMINGLPGPMALETAISCLNRGFTIIPLGFTGKSYDKPDFVLQGQKKSQVIQLIKGPGLNDQAIHELKRMKSMYPDLIIVDYTHPSATLGNVQCYSDCECDFVMGTTGGDPQKLSEILGLSEFSSNSNSGNRKKSITAVIAPNMGKQIVAMQAGLLEMSKRFAGSFDGYTLEVVESHQSSKADTSGTAKAVVASLGILNGQSFNIENIKKLRDKESQIAFGVPESALGGHAFHTYRFISPDGDVVFELKHNVVGRKVYAEGTADAVEFVNNVRKIPSNRRLYNMIDVLESKMGK